MDDMKLEVKIKLWKGIGGLKRLCIGLAWDNIDSLGTSIQKSPRPSLRAEV